MNQEKHKYFIAFISYYKNHQPMFSNIFLETAVEIKSSKILRVIEKEIKEKMKDEDCLTIKIVNWKEI